MTDLFRIFLALAKIYNRAEISSDFYTSLGEHGNFNVVLHNLEDKD